MPELITWLLPQLDDDERVALEAAAAGASGSAEHWRAERVEYRHADTGVHDTWIINGDRVKTPTLAMCPVDVTPRIAEHIARWDPARVLAEVEAKRRIVDLHREIHLNEGGTGCATCTYSDYWPCRTLRLLAQPYAGHDGWQEEWRV